jgi:hypothetical protein
MFAIHEADCLVPFLRVAIAKRRQDNVVLRKKHLHTKFERQPMLEPVAFVFGGIEFKLHATLYVNHI